MKASITVFTATVSAAFSLGAVSCEVARLQDSSTPAKFLLALAFAAPIIGFIVARLINTPPQGGGVDRTDL